ncbi:MAG: thermonuclease family protein [Planctomycetota bacterium]
MRPNPTPRQLRRRTRRNRALALAITLLVILVLARLDHLGLLLAPEDDLDRYHGQTFTVLRVVDGDTLIIDAPDATQSPTRPETRVRLWGIDAPETAKPQRNRPAERGADAATRYLEQLALNQPVTLYLEAHRPRGRFGRLLAHAALTPSKPTDTVRGSPPDDFPQRSLSHQLVAAGLVRADNTWPHRFAEQLQAAEDGARNQRLGLWSREPDPSPPPAPPPAPPPSSDADPTEFKRDSPRPPR